jgi:hypothetical protein
MGIGMKKTIRYTVFLFLLIEILVLLVNSPTAKAVTRGVYIGNSFTYGTPDGSPWVQTYPPDVPPLARWAQFVNSSRLSFTILNYSNPNSLNPGFSFNETLTFRNGMAPVHTTGYIDLYFGAGLGATFFISPGLQVGDYIYPGAAASGNYTWKINTTRIDRLYWPGVPVCILNYTSYTPYINQSSPLIARQSTFIWDQRTGVLLGVYEGAYGVEQSAGITLQGALLYELIANNIQIPMNYPSSLDLTPIYVTVAIGGVVVLGVVIVRAVQNKPKGKYKRLKER